MITVKNFELPKKTLTLWQIRFAVAAVILLSAAAFLYKISVYFLIPLGVLALFFSLVVIIYLPAFFKSCKIRFLDGTVIIERGVFIKSTHIMPFSRMIISQLLSTPLSRMMGLSAVTLKSARRVLVIPEIRTEDAKDFISLITREEQP